MLAGEVRTGPGRVDSTGSYADVVFIDGWLSSSAILTFDAVNGTKVGIVAVDLN